MTTRRPKFGMLLLVGGIVASWLAVMLWLALQPQRTDGMLGVDDKTSHGAAAVVSVLEDHGIAVRPAQTMYQLRAELQRHDDAVVLFHDQHAVLQTASYTRLAELAELVVPQRRVFAGVSGAEPPALFDGIYPTGSIGYRAQLEVEASCDLPAAQAAGDISGIRQGVVVTDPAHGCFGVDDVLLGEDEAAYAYAATGDGTIVFADWRMLSNAGLSDNGTATLALWALGRADTVIWFQPTIEFAPDADGQLSPVQLPAWARMGLVWAVIVTLLALVVIGRRSGPVITEPLPAEVPAAETTVGRGRMHAAAKHHAHALATLQQASIATLAQLLQLGPTASKDAVLQETATQLGMARADLNRLYAADEQLTSAILVTRAQQLQDIEHRVRHRFSAPPKES